MSRTLYESTPFGTPAERNMQDMRARLAEARDRAGELHRELEAKRAKHPRPTSAQRKALETIEARYEGARNEVAALDARIQTELADGASRSVREIGGLRAYGKGEPLTTGRPSGPGIGDIVRGLVTGDFRGEAATMLTSDVGGGIPTDVTLGILDKARAKSVIFEAGAQIIPMEGPVVKLARMTGQPSPSVEAEATDREIPLSDFAFVDEGMIACSSWIRTRVSIELLEDAANLNSAMSNALAQQMALELDRGALAGSGEGEPLGLVEMTGEDHGIAEVSYLSELTNYKPFVDAIGELRARHHMPNASMLAIADWATLAGLNDGVTQNPLLVPKAYQDLSELVTPYVPTGVSLVGDFTNLVVGIRTNLNLEVSRTGGGAWEAGAVEVRAYMRWGAFVQDPNAFCLIELDEVS